jgi:hypothetical protein
MALFASTIWEVRHDGNDLNGGGFDTFYGGTDYSQQIAPQHGYTDLAIDSSDNTKVTSVARPFVTADAGNLLRINSGTGFTVGPRVIESVAGGAAFLDASAGTLGSTGGQAKLGGALQTLKRVVQDYVAGNKIWLRGGTHNVSGTILFSTPGTILEPVKLEGYGSTRGDGGMPILNAVGSIGTLLQLDNSHQSAENLEIRGSFLAGTGARLSTGLFQYLARILVKQALSIGIHVQANGPSHLFRCSAINISGDTNAFTNAGFWIAATSAQPVLIEQCAASGCGVPGFVSAQGSPYFYRCIATQNQNGDGSGGHGFLFSTTRLPWMRNCNAYGNRGDGLRFVGGPPSEGGMVSNCIFEANQGFGVRNLNTNGSTFTPMDPAYRVLFQRNALFGNTSGTVSHITSGVTDFELTASAFQDPAHGDFRLNASAGGGLLCRSNGDPGTFSFLPNTRGFADIGAVPACAAAAVAGDVEGETTIGLLKYKFSSGAFLSNTGTLGSSYDLSQEDVCEA